MNYINTSKCGCDMSIERMVNEGGLGAELSYPQQSMENENGDSSEKERGVKPC